jgi:signal transduction histidine kinase
MTDAAEVLEALADGVLVAGADGRVEWASDRLRALAGEDVTGRTLNELLAGGARPGQHRAALRTPAGVVPVVVNVAPRDVGWAVIVQDLRPWQGVVDAPRVAGDVDLALGGVFRGALQTSGGEFEAEERVDVIASVLAEQGAQLFRDVDCLIAVVDPGRPDYFEVAGGSGPWASRLVGREFTLQGALVGRAMAGRQAQETSRAQQQSALAEVLEGGEIQTIRLIPIVSARPLPDGRTSLGTIGFYSRQPVPFSDRQRRLMDAFGGLVSLSLVRAALRRAARLGAERLALGVELAVDLSRTLDSREVVGRLLDRALTAVGAERAVLVRIDLGDTVVEDSRDVGGLPDILGYRAPIASQPLMQQAIASEAPVVGGQYAGERLPEQLRRALEGVRSTLTVPLVFSGEVVAVLVLSRRREVAFGADEVATIQLLGNLAVLALRNSWLYAEAEEANRVRSDFMNMAAHELRTPFTVVAGYISMLRDGTFGEIPPALRLPVDTLADKAEELGRLVEDLLLAARLDSGGVPLNRERISLPGAAEAAVERARPRAALLGADLALDAPGSGCDVIADPVHVGRILDNLINNALSYARGTPWVRVRVRRTGVLVRVEVEDRGRGVSPEDARKVFERFYRVDSHGYAQQPGSGLGLYISRGLAERQGGRLELEWSRVGEGSRFVLALPPAAAE